MASGFGRRGPPLVRRPGGPIVPRAAPARAPGEREGPVHLR